MSKTPFEASKPVVKKQRIAWQKKSQKTSRIQQKLLEKQPNNRTQQAKIPKTQKKAIKKK